MTARRRAAELPRRPGVPRVRAVWRRVRRCRAGLPSRSTFGPPSENKVDTSAIRGSDLRALAASRAGPELSHDRAARAGMVTDRHARCEYETSWAAAGRGG